MAVIKHLVDLDLSKNQILNVVLQNLATAPTSPADGQLYWDTADNTAYAWSQSNNVWVDLGSSGVTNLSYTAAVSQGTVVSDTGTNAVIPLADGTNAGLFSPAEKTKLEAIDPGANDDQNASEVPSTASGNLVATNVQDALEELQGDIDTLNSASSQDLGITHNASTVDITIDNGTDITLLEANTNDAGALSSDKFDEITANTLKETNVTTDISIDQTGASQVVVESSDGTDGTITAATTSVAGVMTAADKTKLDGIETGAEANVDDVLTSIGLSANVITYTDEAGNDTTLDLSLYLDDTNLARLTSGSINGTTGIATFTRDDSSTFTIDMSAFLDAITLNDTLISTSTTEGLTAAQGKVLKDLIDTINTNNTGVNTGDEVSATTTVEGIIELATQTEVNTGTDSSRAVTPSTLRSTLGITADLTTTLKYSQLIGDGSATSIIVTHNIGSQFVQAQVFEVAAMDKVECEIELTSTTTTTFKFNVAPATNALRVVIIG